MYKLSWKNITKMCGISLAILLWQMVFFIPYAEAASRTLTSKIDFDSGYYNNVESKSKEGEIKLSSNGVWGGKSLEDAKPDVK